MLLVINFRGYRAKVPVDSFAAARCEFERARDVMGYGASDMGAGCGDLYDTAGKGRIARVSYNGRVWDAVTGEEITLS